MLSKIVSTFGCRISFYNARCYPSTGGAFHYVCDVVKLVVSTVGKGMCNNKTSNFDSNVLKLCVPPSGNVPTSPVEYPSETARQNPSNKAGHSTFRVTPLLVLSDLYEDHSQGR